MLFNSIHFLIFFPTVVIAYFLTPHKFRWIILLISSSYFYMAFVPEYILILYAIIVIDYAVGRWMHTWPRHKKHILFASIFSNLGLLFFFKYFNFFNANVAQLAEFLNWNYSIKYLEIALPLGLSFHTFQSLSYIIEVYRGKTEPEKHLGIYAVYVMFFPQLVAGPIERPQHLIPQFKQEHYPQPSNFIAGFRQMLWGFFKKMVVADNLAPIVQVAFTHPSELNGFSLAIASLAFIIQIYGDFSGYSDVAIGSARIIGFDLSENFKKPFFAKSIAEFWRRWHISLTTWFQDYVFTPLYLSFNRAKLLNKLPHKKRHTLAFALATLTGLTLLGLWHGANWTFVFFGLTQGLGIILYYSTKKWWDKLFAPIQVTLTITIFFIGSIFFRAQSTHDAFLILKKISVELTHALLSPINPDYIKNSLLDLGIFKTTSLYITIGSVLLMLSVEWLTKNDFAHNILAQQNRKLRYAFYYLIMCIIFLYANIGAQPFIYFQF